MTFIGNVLWILVGGGLFIAMGYLFGGLVLCLTIVGIPFGLQCFKLAALALMPFGRTITDRVPPAGCLSIVMNVIWILVGGFWITVLHLAFALLCAVTIIGIPFAQQHVKLAALALTPFGRTFA
jgi:uncharacterized membrane protein YccF (DUF307 family)